MVAPRPSYSSSGVAKQGRRAPYAVAVHPKRVGSARSDAASSLVRLGNVVLLIRFRLDERDTFTGSPREESWGVLADVVLFASTLSSLHKRASSARSGAGEPVALAVVDVGLARQTAPPSRSGQGRGLPWPACCWAGAGAKRLMRTRLHRP